METTEPETPWELLSLEERHRRYRNVNDLRTNGNVHRGALPVIEKNPATGRLRYTRALGEGGKPIPEHGIPDEELPQGLWLRGNENEVPPQERYRRARQVVARAFAIERFREVETLPFRIRVAYRITRELARVKGLVEPEETLAEALVSSLGTRDPWTTPTPVRRPPSGAAAHNRAAGGLMELLDQADRLPELSRAWAQTDSGPAVLGTGGLALVPPKPPRCEFEDLEALELLPNYLPQHDPLLKRWCYALEEINRYLGLERGSQEVPEMGRLGFLDLVDPRTARDLWPTRLQILFWEESLVQEAEEILVSDGAAWLRKVFKQRHGLTRWESDTLGRQAMALLRGRSEFDVEEQRSLMVARLESFMRRAKSALDLRAELAGLKQLAIVQGLGKTDPEDAISAFAGIVKSLDAKEAPRGFIDASGPPKLTG